MFLHLEQFVYGSVCKPAVNFLQGSSVKASVGVPAGVLTCPHVKYSMFSSAAMSTTNRQVREYTFLLKLLLHYYLISYTIKH